ncbi:MAG TPA: D-amino-acid transaminase [Alphaproteobacteria bacterium]|nr:D-amino-acid transaminase [Alphaproteobacteria bacterium]
MSRIAYVNGAYVPHRDAAVHVEDRGYQFADGVYEVIGVARGRLVDEGPHFVRLKRSLGELRLAAPMAETALKTVLREVIRRNRLKEGCIYLQVTRGVAPRDFAFPKGVPSALVVTAKHMRAPPEDAVARGVRVITIPDIRWQRCDIKVVGLTAAVLGKQRAREAGAYEAWQVDAQGFVTEGTSSNAWIVTEDGKVVTRQATSAILNGITRLSVIELARRAKLGFEERPFSVAEAKRAREAMITSTTSFVMPVTEIDGVKIGGGKAGPFARRLREAYRAHAAGAGASDQ